MNSIINSFITVITINQLLFAAFELYPSSTLNVAGGALRLNKSNYLMDIFSDPASLANLHKLRAEFIWGRPFELKEFEYATGAFAFKFRGYGVGIGISSFGNPIYKESITSAMMGKQKFKKCS